MLIGILLNMPAGSVWGTNISSESAFSIPPETDV
jgi:hypothetical protein